MSILRAAALAYATRIGLHVFPLAPKTKMPTAGSHGHLDASNDPATITAWWTENPMANIGIAVQSSGIVVIDIDRRHGGDEQDLDAPAPDTWRAQTSDGVHLYFAVPDGVELTNFDLRDGLQVKADGYVVAPPSVHPDGPTYRWEIGYGPRDLALAPLPAWVGTRLRERPAGAGRLAVDGTPLRITTGERNRRLFQLASALRRYGLNARAISACLQAVNREHVVEPLGSGEVEKIAASASRYTVSITNDTNTTDDTTDDTDLLMLRALGLEGAEGP